MKFYPRSKLAVLAVFVLSLLALANVVSAQLPARPNTVDAAGLFNILKGIADWIFTFLIVVAVIFALFAAYQYMTAAGDEEKLSQARINTIYAMVALAVGILAFSIPRIVVQIIGQGPANLP